MDAAAGSLDALLELAARDEAAGLGDAPWPPHFQKTEGEAPRVAPSRAKPGGAGKRRRARAARADAARHRRELAQTRTAALAGLERWKQRHPDAAAHLAVDDVLVDAMRGRSSTWTRIRVNLRHVPEEMRPPAGDARPRRRPDARVARGRPQGPGIARERCRSRLALTPTLSRKREREKSIRSPRPAKRGEGQGEGSGGNFFVAACRFGGRPFVVDAKGARR